MKILFSQAFNFQNKADDFIILLQRLAVGEQVTSVCQCRYRLREFTVVHNIIKSVKNRSVNTGCGILLKVSLHLVLKRKKGERENNVNDAVTLFERKMQRKKLILIDFNLFPFISIIGFNMTFNSLTSKQIRQYCMYCT
ncbi:hypothetical protein ABFS83_06G202200 [Erythranthe nasuta]